jgi:hypothetical protein
VRAAGAASVAVSVAGAPAPRRAPSAASRQSAAAKGAARCRRKFLSIFPGGFRDSDFVDLERDYKWQAHLRWQATLSQERFAQLLDRRQFEVMASHATSIESRTNLLFSFEKMALRDAVRSLPGARAFAQGLYALLHGDGSLQDRFTAWCNTVASLPRRQTRVYTWPIITVFPFIAQPKLHLYLKPTVTRIAARVYGYDFAYRSGPNWDTYRSLLEFGRTVRRDLRDLRPRDQIDIQSFIWIQGSDEYA